jgi:hypothetical protein
MLAGSVSGLAIGLPVIGVAVSGVVVGSLPEGTERSSTAAGGWEVCWLAQPASTPITSNPQHHLFIALLTTFLQAIPVI